MRQAPAFRLAGGIGLCLLLSAMARAQAAAPTMAADQSRLPRINDLLQSVRTSQLRVMEGQRRYLCRQTVSVQQLAPDSDARLTDTFRFETFFVNGVPIDRLLERNGLPLTEAQQRAEEQRVARVIDEATRETPAPLQWDNTMGGMILARAKLKHEHRILVDARPVIAFQIEPHTTVPHTPMEAVAESLRGELWIDEQDAVVLRMEASAPGSIAFFGNLVVPKGFRVACYESRRLGEGAYILQNWCKTVLPSIPLALHDATKVWNHRVQRTEFHLDGCRVFHSNARVLSNPTP